MFDCSALWSEISSGQRHVNKPHQSAFFLANTATDPDITSRILSTHASVRPAGGSIVANTPRAFDLLC